MTPRASASQNNTTKPQRRFQFIDNTDVSTNSNNSTQVRRHVMQEYMREKRWEARSVAENTVYQQAPPMHTFRVPRSEVRKSSTQRQKKDGIDLSRSTPRRSRLGSSPKRDVVLLPRMDGPDKSDTRIRPTAANALSSIPGHHSNRSQSFQMTAPIPKRQFSLNADSFACLTDMLPVVSKPAVDKQFDMMVDFMRPKQIRERFRTCPSPVTLLSAARIDPFNALPVVLSQKEYELFDLYATVMSAHNSGINGRNSQAQDWHHDVLIPEAMKSGLIFRILVLQHAAEYQYWLMGLDITEISSFHRARTARTLDHHKSDFPEDCSDEFIAALISASAEADRDQSSMQTHLIWQYWAAAVHKIRQYGGPEKLERTPSLCKFINWHDYLLPGYDGRGSSFYFTPQSILELGEIDVHESYGRQEIKQQCEEFFVFLQCVEQLASVTESQSNNPTARRHQRFRYSIFGSDRCLHNLLAPGDYAHNISIDSRRQTICRLAALITVNIAIWAYRHDSGQSEAFLEELDNSLKYNELTKYTSVETLLQILLCSSYGHIARCAERPWLVGRLLKVTKRLGKDSWEWLNGFLWSCLALTKRERDVTEHWKKRLYNEILTAPLHNHTIQR